MLCLLWAGRPRACFARGETAVFHAVPFSAGTSSPAHVGISKLPPSVMKSDSAIKNAVAFALGFLLCIAVSYDIVLSLLLYGEKRFLYQGILLPLKPIQNYFIIINRTAQA